MKEAPAANHCRASRAPTRRGGGLVAPRYLEWVARQRRKAHGASKQGTVRTKLFPAPIEIN